MATLCSHPEAHARLVCVHVAADDGHAYFLRYTGEGTEYWLVCAACVDIAAPVLAGACPECFQAREGYVLDASGICGRPEVRERASRLSFAHRSIHVPGLKGAEIAALAPLASADGRTWLVLVAGTLARLDVEMPGLSPIVELSGEPTLDPTEPLRIEASPDGRFAAVVHPSGRHGVVVDLATGAVTMRLDRGAYHEEHSAFSIAFFMDGGRAVLVHATAWNRLDLSDPADGTLLTPRGPTSYVDGKPPEHYLDYFHAGLSVSPDGRWLVDDGWVWHPVGMMRRLDLRRWRHENPWESEDGDSVALLRPCSYHWDGPRAFADDRTLVVWGFGPDDEQMVDAAALYDVEAGRLRRWFAGPPRGRFVVDRHLIVTTSTGTTVWDLGTGERLLVVDGFAPLAFHPHGRYHLSVAADGALVASRLLGD